MARNLKQGMPVVQAFDYHWQTLSSTENPGRNWYLAFNVWRNQLQLAKKGASQVPLIISRIALGDNFDDIPPSPDGCSIFTPGAEGCEEEPVPDPFESIFK